MSERTIKTTGPGWSVMGKSLILTNRSLTHGARKILLEEVKSVDIETRVGNMPRIKISIRRAPVRRTEHIEFEKRGGGHSLLIFGGAPEFAHAEISAYTAYWASLITMAVFMFGERKDETKPIQAHKKMEDNKDRPIGWGLKREMKTE